MVYSVIHLSKCDFLSNSLLLKFSYRSKTYPLSQVFLKTQVQFNPQVTNPKKLTQFLYETADDILQFKHIHLHPSECHRLSNGTKLSNINIIYMWSTSISGKEKQTVSFGTEHLTLSDNTAQFE